MLYNRRKQQGPGQIKNLKNNTTNLCAGFKIRMCEWPWPFQKLGNMVPSPRPLTSDSIHHHPEDNMCIEDA